MKTTKRHFRIFKEECERWIDIINLRGWKFYYEHTDLKARAACVWPDRSADRAFTLSLSTDFGDQLTDYDICQVAFHEVMEALLYRISYLGECRYIQPEEIDEERHNLIRILETILFPKYPGKFNGRR